MPCRDGGPSDSCYKELEKRLNRATRAACDMRTIVRRFGMEGELAWETREWIAEHDAVDAARIAEEDARGERERVRQAALEKLNMDERRVLGL